MTNEELNEIISRADDEYDQMKDRIHDLFEENKKLQGRIEELEYLLEREKKAHKDTEDYFEENWKPINPMSQYNLNEKDYH